MKKPTILSAPPDSSHTKSKLWPAILIITLGAALRLFGLGSESLWLDEGSTVAWLSRSWAELISDGTQGPLFLAFQKIWSGIFGISEFSLRLPQAVLGIAVLWFFYRLGAELFDEQTGRIAIFLAAINPFLIFYSQDARPYSMFLLGALGSTFYWIRLIKSGRTRDGICYGIFVLIAAYSHPYSPFLLLSHFIGAILYMWSAAHRFSARRVRKIAAAFISAGLLFLPQIFIFGELFVKKTATGEVAAWIAPPNLTTILDTTRQYFMDRRLAAFLCVIIITALIVTRRNTRRVLPPFLLLATIGFCLLALPWIISRTITPIYVIRYTIPALGSALLIAAWAVSVFRRPLGILILVVILGVEACSLYGYYTQIDKDPWRETAAYLANNARMGDLIALYPPLIAPSFRYYNISDSVPVVVPNSTQEFLQVARHPGPVWIVNAYRVVPDQFASLEKYLSASHGDSETIRIKKSLACNPRAFHIADIRIIKFPPLPSGSDGNPAF